MDMKKINDLIGVYEGRLTTLKNLKSLIEGDPELALEVLQALAPNGSTMTPLRGTKKKSGQYEQMVEYMGDGQWRTLPEIADGINAKKTSIAPYLYRNDTKAQFESRKHPDMPRMMQWRLKQPDGSGESNESIK